MGNLNYTITVDVIIANFFLFVFSYNGNILFLSSDIDECDTGHNCERVCENLIGSYKCACPPGFELNADNTTCRGNRTRNRASR